MGTWEKPHEKFPCGKCGAVTSFIWERESCLYCEACFTKRLNTAAGEAYERWFVEAKET
jgi:hypothetical protein